MFPIRRLIAALVLSQFAFIAPVSAAPDADALRTAIKQNSRDTASLLERQEKLAGELDKLAVDMAAAAKNNSSEVEEARLQLEIAEIDFKQNPNPRSKRQRDMAAARFQALGGQAGTAKAPIDVNALRAKHTAISNELKFINDEVSRLDGEMSAHRKNLRALQQTTAEKSRPANKAAAQKTAGKQHSGKASGGAKKYREPARPDQPAITLDENFTLLLSSADINAERRRIKVPASDEPRVLRSKGLGIETWHNDSKSDSSYTLREQADGQFKGVIKLKRGLNVLRSGEHRWVMEVPAEDDGAAYVFVLDNAATPAQLKCWSGKR